MNRCLNDCFSYCKGNPDCTVEERDIAFIDLGGKLATQHTLVTICKKDYRICPDNVAHHQLQPISCH